MKNKYYAYHIPSINESGILNSWEECEKKVSGRANAAYKSFKTRKEAEQWLEAGADYSFKKDFEPGIYFDAGTGRGMGVEASVTDEKGENLLSKILSHDELNEFGKLVLGNDVTNNYGELLAMKFALKLAIKKKVKKIFGDSRLVINHWSKGFVKIENVSRGTLELIDEVFDLRKKFEDSGGAVIHVAGEDNPADLGFHK